MYADEDMHQTINHAIIRNLIVLGMIGKCKIGIHTQYIYDSLYNHMNSNFKQQHAIPGLRHSNFRHKSLQPALKSLLSKGNCNSADFTMFWSNCAPQDTKYICKVTITTWKSLI